MKISSSQGKFEPMRIDKNARSRGIIRISLLFHNIKVCYVFSLESPHRVDSNEYTQYTVFNIKMKITLNYPKSAANGFFPRHSRTSLESRGKRAISVQATEVLLYYKSNLSLERDSV